MLFLLSCLPFFAVFAWLASLVADALGVRPLYVWIGYYALSEMLESRHLTKSHALRASRLVAYVGRVLMRCDYSAEAKQRLEQLAKSGQQVVFACEPHGIACSHMVWGFAAHGGALPDMLASRTLVVAHVVFKCIPIVRNLYAAFGVIDNRASSVQQALQDGYSIALVPSSILGKAKSLSAPAPVADDDDDALPAVTIWRRASMGCFAYARRRNIAFVPVLSPDEDYAYRRFVTASGSPLWVLALGWWLVRPYCDLEWRVGRTLAPGAKSVASFAQSVYDEFGALASGDYTLVARRANDVVFGGGDL